MLFKKILSNLQKSFPVQNSCVFYARYLEGRQCRELWRCHPCGTLRTQCPLCGQLCLIPASVYLAGPHNLLKAILILLTLKKFMMYHQCSRKHTKISVWLFPIYRKSLGSGKIKPHDMLQKLKGPHFSVIFRVLSVWMCLRMFAKRNWREL